jgi:peptidoglycan/xylan/chitin deacetylase (PgdA/CDA1 family)
MMTSQQVAELHRTGMTIGAHTVSHPILLGVPTIQARSEIVTNKTDLERIIGSPITLFAYPNGIPNRDYGLEHVKMVEELGFDGAVSTAWGASRAGSDVFQIPRFTPWDRPSWKYGLRLLQNLSRDPIERAA